MGVTNTVDYKCHNRGVITELILHKHTCINRKVGVLDLGMIRLMRQMN